MVFQIDNRESPSKWPLKTYEWAILTQLNGEKTAAQISEILSLSFDETRRYLLRLLQYGLIQPAGSAQDAKLVPRSWIEKLNYEMTMSLGPIAEILLEESFLEMQCKPTEMAQNQYIAMIDWLSKEISTESRRVEFLQKMIDFVLQQQNHP
jgi:DNA-binding IclR family transcriptional regulator